MWEQREGVVRTLAYEDSDPEEHLALNQRGGVGGGGGDNGVETKEMRERGKRVSSSLSAMVVASCWVETLRVVFFAPPSFLSSLRPQKYDIHFFLTGPRGGVTGRPELRPPY